MVSVKQCQTYYVEFVDIQNLNFFVFRFQTVQNLNENVRFSDVVLAYCTCLFPLNGLTTHLQLVLGQTAKSRALNQPFLGKAENEGKTNLTSTPHTT